jgi:hypothetical protein
MSSTVHFGFGSSSGTTQVVPFDVEAAARDAIAVPGYGS